MKYPIVNTLSHTHLQTKTYRQNQCTNSFYYKCPLHYFVRQLNNTAYLQRVDALLHQSSLPQSNLSAKKDREENAHRHKAKTTYLDQHDNYKLPKDRPVHIRINHDKSRHATSTDGSKQRICK